MRNDSRLSRMLHVLIHMHQQGDAMTSELLAKMLNTNAVVVRRTMAGLRDKAYVQSEKGHRGGWRLIVKLEDISLLDVYKSLGEPPIFALGLANDQPQCLVEQAVNAGLTDALYEAKTLLMTRLAQVTVAQLAQDFEQRALTKGIDFSAILH